MGLVVDKIVKKYGENTVVDQLSFRMDQPGVYALLGRNGAGKTTTIRMMLGMLAMDGGSVTWNDKPLSPFTTNIGYLAEERGLYPKYTLMDQLIYFSRLKNISEQEAKKRIKYWAERLQVEEYIYPTTSADQKKTRGKGAIQSRKAEQLSKGNQQKIQLMASLISDPDLIIFDEPLSGLDPVNADIFRDIIHDCIRKEKYIIMSSHQMSTIEEFCTDLTILNRGKDVLSGNLNKIKKSYGRVNMYLKSEEDLHPYIKEHNLTILEETPDGIHIKVSGQEEADHFLKDLASQNVSLIRFELREPSLHEIFVSTVGNDSKAGDEHE